MIKTIRSLVIARALSMFAAAATVALVFAAPALAEESHPAPHWNILSRSAPSVLEAGKEAMITAVVANLGDSPVESNDEAITLTDDLPAGVTPVGKMLAVAEFGANNKELQVPVSCAVGSPCEFPKGTTIPPFIAIEVQVRVNVEPGADGVLGENVLSVSGGNAPSLDGKAVLKAGAGGVPFGMERYELTPETESGATDTQAGSHPFQLTTTLAFDQTFDLENKSGELNEKKELVHRRLPSIPDLLRNVNTTLPPGLVGNTNSYVTGQCTGFDFSVLLQSNANECPNSSAVGAAIVTFRDPGIGPGYKSETVPVFNLVPEAGEPARFGFEFEKVPVTLDTSIQTGKGYAVEVDSNNISSAASVMSTIVTIWGTPAAEVHNDARGWECLGGGFKLETHPHPCVNPTGPVEASPYLTLPALCSSTAMNSSVALQSWKEGASFLPAFAASNPIQLTGCNELPFDEPLSKPSISVQPDESAASTPSGLKVEVKVPQTSTLAPDGLAEADIGQNTVALPVGMETNPGAANGLETCSTGAAGLLGSDSDSDTGAKLGEELSAQQFTPAAAACVDGSKIGTVKIHSPLLERELTGSVFLGDQNTNPFAPVLVLYLVAEDPISGVRVKLAGETVVNPDGQLVTTFKNTPPVPFETLQLHLFNGARASQATPSLCKTYESTAEFVPSSGEAPVQASSSFKPTPNPDGVPCPESGPLPFSPGFETGSSVKQAGAFTPFTLTIGRPDGDAALKTISMKLPPGLAAVLGSVPLCPEAQAANGSCGEESLIGTSTALAGLGGAPYSLPGKVYLTGPYNGAPFGLSAVTEATHVGPFNVGTIVARSSISVDEVTAAATINTEAVTVFPSDGGAPEQFSGLPDRIKGLPSQLKELNVTVDRPGFQFNPTNCTPMATTGTLTGYEGTSSPVSSPFEVTGCGSLPFAPKITSSVKGQGSKVNGVAFNVTVESPGLGQANIHRVDLTLPKALPSRLDTIQKACRVQIFEVNPAACDEGSVIGEGIVHTPVFKNPLRGPAYLVGHAGESFPDVEFVLQGEGVTVLLDGKTFIEKGITFSKFETSPDAPFTKFESIFPEGPHSALGVESLLTGPERNLCKLPLSIPTEIEGQNGAKINETMNVAITGCGAVLHVKTTKLTRKQQLAKALKACRTKYKAKSKKAKRLSCEKQARKKYGPKKPAKKHSAKKSAHKK